MSKSWNLNLWLLRGLHLLLALAVPAVLTLMLGCMKAKEIKEDLGPENSPQSVNGALGEIETKANFDHLAIGQFLIFTDTRRIENGDSAILLGQRKIDVLDRQDTTTQAHFTIRIVNSVRQLDEKYETTATEEALWLNKVSSAVTSLGLKPVTPQKLSAESLAHSSDASVPAPKKITFHHLRTSDGIVPASLTLKNRNDCAGLNPCELPAHFVQFDMVIWADDTNYQKISFDFAFSTKTPFIPFGTDFDQ
ncbi:MAG: hypothetical protein ACXVA9_11675, partial [Bdellovibrionales bacterium]